MGFRKADGRLLSVLRRQPQTTEEIPRRQCCLLLGVQALLTRQRTRRFRQSPLYDVVTLCDPLFHDAGRPRKIDWTERGQRTL